MLLYRDIKFQHGPGTMGTLALAFLAFGVHTWVVRAYAIVWPLVAHLFVLRQTRSFGLPERALASAFFLTAFFSLDGHAVWPTTIMTALALPIAAALSRDRILRAGLLIGVAILFKQTAAYVLVFAVVGLAFERRWRSAAILLLAGSIPYWATVAVFAGLGAGPEMLRWTVEVPFSIKPAFVSARPTVFDASVLLFAFFRPSPTRCWSAPASTRFAPDGSFSSHSASPLSATPDSPSCRWWQQFHAWRSERPDSSVGDRRFRCFDWRRTVSSLLSS